VTLEGPDGSGKTTQANRLAATAATAALDVVLTREPGGTKVGELIRSILLDVGAPPVADGDRGLDPRTEALLFNAARARLVDEVIRPALERGALVVCARFADSTLAYQGSGHGLDLAELRALAQFATCGLRPDLTILLDVPAEAGLRRKAAADSTRFEALGASFHERVRSGFLALAAAEPDRFTVLDGTRPVDEVFAAVVDSVAALPGLAALGAAVIRTDATRPRSS
jgi:dTMP kinase